MNKCLRYKRVMREEEKTIPFHTLHSSIEKHAQVIFLILKKPFLKRPLPYNLSIEDNLFGVLSRFWSMVCICINYGLYMYKLQVYGLYMYKLQVYGLYMYNYKSMVCICTTTSLWSVYV